MENELFPTPETENEFTVPAEAPVEAPVEAPAEEAAQSPIQKILANKKLLAMAGIAVVAIVAIILVISLFAKGPNKYTTPLDLEMKVQNAQSYKEYEKAQLKLSNGLANDLAEDALSIMKKNDDYKDYIEEQTDDYKDKVEDLKDEYGKNYKYYYKVEEKEKIEKDDLKDIQDEIRDEFKSLYSETKDVDSDEIEEIADMMDIKKSDVKKLLEAAKSYYKKMKSAKVSAGYELEVTFYVDGKELDEPEELGTETIEVYKVNGRWVTLDNLDISLF